MLGVFMVVYTYGALIYDLCISFDSVAVIQHPCILKFWCFFAQKMAGRRAVQLTAHTSRAWVQGLGTDACYDRAMMWMWFAVTRALQAANIPLEIIH